MKKHNDKEKSDLKSVYDRINRNMSKSFNLKASPFA